MEEYYLRRSSFVHGSSEGVRGAIIVVNFQLFYMCLRISVLSYAFKVNTCVVKVCYNPF